MRTLFWRLWSVFVGFVMIILSLLAQLAIFLPLASILTPLVLPKVNVWYAILALYVLVNSVSCYEYFCKRRVVVMRSKVHQLSALVRPRTSHAVMAFFLVPRGIDRIVTGREFTG
jgi:hypothetical protein